MHQAPDPSTAPYQSPETVSRELTSALAVLRQGGRTVLVASPAQAAVALVAVTTPTEPAGGVAPDATMPPGDSPGAADGGGRLAVFVGDPARVADRDLARVMAEELFAKPSSRR